MFKDRKEAGQLLAEKLMDYKNDPSTIVLAIPRGGIVPAYEIAHALNLPLEVALVKKIGHPTNKEYAIGAVSLNSEIMTHEDLVSADYLEDEKKRIRNKLKELQGYFLNGREPLKLKNKKVIIVDDGIATGLTLKMVIELVKNENPFSVIVAVPVAPRDSIREIESNVDEVVCLSIPDYFRSVGEHYAEFDQVESSVVASLLKKANPSTE